MVREDGRYRMICTFHIGEFMNAETRDFMDSSTINQDGKYIGGE